jgi:hypothetical protein
MAAVFGAVFIGWMCLRLIASRGGSGLGTGDELVMQVIAGTIVVCVLALAAATLLWALFGQEEWRMAPDVLELRRELLGRTWVRSYGGASLTIRSHRHHPDPWGRTCELVVEMPGTQDVLHSGWFVPLRDMEALGRFVAEHTGWSLRENAGWFTGSERDPYSRRR